MTVRVGVGRMLTLGPLLLSLWGCHMAYPEPFSRFQPEGKVAAGPMVDRIVVEPVNEARPAGGRSSIGKGALAFIPLWPYGSQQWRTIGHRHDLRAGLQSAVVNDLIASGLARDVFSGSYAEISPKMREFVAQALAGSASSR